MPTRLLIPRISAPTWGGKYGKPLRKIQILDGNAAPTIQLEENTSRGKEILQFEMTGINIPNWVDAPIICSLIEEGKKRTLKVTFPQRANTPEFTVNLLNPCEPAIQETSGPAELFAKGLEHVLGIRANFSKITMEACSSIVGKNPDTNLKKIISSLDSIMEECRKENITWKKKKQEFDPSEKLSQWPKGYLREWIRMLSRTKTFEAPEAEIEHLEKNWHKWNYMPAEGEEPPQNAKEEYLICPPMEEDFLFFKRTLMLCALENRPEEILDYIWENPRYQEIAKTSQTPVEEFLNEWGSTIPMLRGVLLPNF